MRALIALLVVLVSASSGRSQTALMIQRHGEDAVVEFDLATGTIVREGLHDLVGYDLVLSEDGNLFVGAECVERHDWAGISDDCWFGTPTAPAPPNPVGHELAFFASGDLAVLDGWPIPDGLVIVSPSGESIGALHPPAGFSLMAFDVPRAGPFEDGVVALVVDRATPHGYHLLTWARGPDGSFVASVPQGPLPLTPEGDCRGTINGCTWDIAVRADGLSFLAGDPTVREVLEFDLDGNALGIFAHVPWDTAASAMRPGSRSDAIADLDVNAADQVLVTTYRKAHLYDADGTIIRHYDHIFENARAVTFNEWQPFESAGAECAPWSVGFWKRQCSSLGRAQRFLRSRRSLGLPPPPPIHPAAELAGLERAARRVDVALADHGTTACAALQPESPNDWRTKALRRYAAVLLNVEYRKLGRRCVVTVEGTPTDVAAVLTDVRALLASAADDDLKRAFHLCGVLLREEGD